MGLVCEVFGTEHVRDEVMLRSEDSTQPTVLDTPCIEVGHRRVLSLRAGRPSRVTTSKACSAR